MSNLSSHSAQRLVSLLHLLTKRHAKLKAALETHTLVHSIDATPDNVKPDTAHQDHNTVTSSSNVAIVPSSTNHDAFDPERAALELQLYSDFLRIVLEIINAILANALPSNPELVYALLHRQEVFVPFRHDERLSELMHNISFVIEYFGKKVEDSSRQSGASPVDDATKGGVGIGLSAENVLEVIKKHSIGWRKDKLKAFPELRFTYEEEASSDFFIPYVWSLNVSMVPLVPFTLSAITAFVPSSLQRGREEVMVEESPLGGASSSGIWRDDSIGVVRSAEGNV